MQGRGWLAQHQKNSAHNVQGFHGFPKISLCVQNSISNPYLAVRRRYQRCRRDDGDSCPRGWRASYGKHGIRNPRPPRAGLFRYSKDFSMCTEYVSDLLIAIRTRDHHCRASDGEILSGERVVVNGPRRPSVSVRLCLRLLFPPQKFSIYSEWYSDDCITVCKRYQCCCGVQGDLCQDAGCMLAQDLSGTCIVGNRLRSCRARSKTSRCSRNNESYQATKSICCLNHCGAGMWQTMACHWYFE